MNQELENDKTILLKERERSEKEAGSSVYKDLVKLRYERDRIRLFQKQEKEKSDYEQRVEKYEKKANKGALDDSDKAEKVQSIVFWVLKSPAILLILGSVGLLIYYIVCQIINWSSMDGLERLLVIVGSCILIPIAAGVIALINALINLVAVIAHGLIWDVYVFFARLFSKRNIKTYNDLHPSGLEKAIWHYQAKLYEHNNSFAENEVLRFPDEKDFYDKHKKAYFSFSGDMKFSTIK